MMKAEPVARKCWKTQWCLVDNYVTGLTRTEIADLMGIDWRVK